MLVTRETWWIMTSLILRVSCDNSKYIKFADDVTILLFLRQNCDDSLQCEFQHVKGCSNAIGLSINYDKCAVMNCITKNSISVSSIFPMIMLLLFLLLRLWSYWALRFLMICHGRNIFPFCWRSVMDECTYFVT